MSKIPRSPPVLEPVLFDIYRESTFPLPPLPQLNDGDVWDTVFIHESLPGSNSVLAILGRSIFTGCVAEWLMDGDRNVTRSELQVCTAPLTPVAISLTYTT